jgi:predicted acylesterase/phospholipase RssA
MMTERDVVSAEELRAILAGHEAFSHLSERASKSLARAAERELVPAGEVLLDQGEVPDFAFVVVHGRLRAFDELASHRAGRAVAWELGRGDVVAINLLVARMPSPGAVTALRDTTVLRLGRDALLRCMGAHPELVMAQARHFYEIALRTHDARPARPCIFTLLPSGGSFAIDEVVDPFVRALGETLGPTTAVSSRRAHEMFGFPARAGDSLRARISEWCSEQEAAGRVVLFVCDREATPWTRWCLEQTDRIVAAVDPGDLGAVAQLDRIFASRRVRSPASVDLLLVHPPGVEAPHGTRPWMDVPFRRSHHHVRLDRLADFRRAARRVGERGVALVLGGGGARALAHIGVLQALEEAGVAIDAIGGASMGAVVAAGYARGRSPREMLRLFGEKVPDARALRDVAFPSVSLFSGRKLDDVLRFAFDDLDASDLWIPCFCVSADIEGSRLVVHDRGSLWRSVRASCSLPGVFPPVRLDGSLLVDGGVIDNVPIDVMERQHPGTTIIAVDVGTLGEGTNGEPLPRRKGRSALDRLRGNGSAPPTPNIFGILTSSSMFGSRQELRRLIDEGHADLFLTPPVDHVKLLAFEDRETLYRLGYEHARKMLSAWSGLGRVAAQAIGERAHAAPAAP